MEEWIQCWQEGPIGAPYLAAITTFSVGRSLAPAVPTLSEMGYGLLVLALILAGLFLIRQRV